MGIDVGWNCAISLRPLDEGEEADAHRMPSNYADWDVNARLPHGIENVKKHLAEVDNVPLLVSLYTDATKHNTAEMVRRNRYYFHMTILEFHSVVFTVSFYRLVCFKTIATQFYPLAYRICHAMMKLFQWLTCQLE